jgi:hypothetical protein
MTQTMKPRKIWTAVQAGTVTEIQVRGEWHRIPQGTAGMFLIGTSRWTIKNAQGDTITDCSGNTSFEVR